MEHTPSVILNNVEDAVDRKIIIRFDAAYLAARHDGALQGHYHNYGDGIAELLPNVLNNPDAILRMDNGRLNLMAIIPMSKGNTTVVSVELDTVKDINSEYSPYNLVVTMTPAKDNYIRNNIRNHGAAVEYIKDDLPQVNPQLYEWLSIINGESSSDTKIPQNGAGVNTQYMQNSENNSSDGQKSYLPAELQERENAAAAEKAENARRLAEEQSEKQRQQETQTRRQREETAGELRRQNAELRKRLERAQRETRVTTEKTVREEDVARLTRRILREYSSTLKSDSILDAMQTLGDTIVQGEQLDYDTLHGQALNIVRQIIDHSEALIDDGESAAYAGIRQYLRENKIAVSEAEKADIPDYEAWRRRNQRRLNLSREGTPVDVIYGEMQELFGKGLLPDIYMRAYPVRPRRSCRRAAA